VTLTLYAITGERPKGPLGVGISGGPLRAARAAGAWVVVERAAAPELSLRAVRAHDRVVRRVARAAPAVLPVRFGTTAADARALAALLAPVEDAIADALDRVRGCVQYTHRVYVHGRGAHGRGAHGRGAHGPDAHGRDAHGPDARDRDAPGRDAPGRARASGARRTATPAAGVAERERAREGPGARWLGERLRMRRVPEAAALSDATRPWVKAERAERHDRPPLVGSVYHLVRREDARAYRAALAKAVASGHGGVRVETTGPWPPYAFSELP
jgi:hypothetical protein